MRWSELEHVAGLGTAIVREAAGIAAGAIRRGVALVIPQEAVHQSGGASQSLELRGVSRSSNQAFLRESDMTPAALRSADIWWDDPSEPDFVATEIVGPDAIADVVAVQFDRVALAARRAAGIDPVVDRLALLCVLATRNRPLGIAELARELCVTPSGARRAIRVGVDAGALVRHDDGRIGAHDAWAPVIARTVAVELKLADAWRALDQATRYRKWADSAWVVVAKHPTSDALSYARVQGVGVALLSPAGEFQVLRRPRSRRARDWSTLWAAEQVVARALAAGYEPAMNRQVKARRARPAGTAARAAV